MKINKKRPGLAHLKKMIKHGPISILYIMWQEWKRPLPNGFICAFHPLPRIRIPASPSMPPDPPFNTPPIFHINWTIMVPTYNSNNLCPLTLLFNTPPIFHINWTIMVPKYNSYNLCTLTPLFNPPHISHQRDHHGSNTSSILINPMQEHQKSLSGLIMQLNLTQNVHFENNLFSPKLSL